MYIIGAGLAGLLAARYFAHLNPTIMERNSIVPNNHSALLRFRSTMVSDMIGIPFKSVEITKAVLTEDDDIKNYATLRDQNAYSLKILNRVEQRSILNLDAGTRYISPPDLITQLADNAKIELGFDAQSEFYKTTVEPIISTIPMPILMLILDYPSIPEFKSKLIWNVNCIVGDMDVYQTLYMPYRQGTPYRISITGNRMTMEYVTSVSENAAIGDIEHYLWDMTGRKMPFLDVTIREQPYGKIFPINDDARKAFMFWASNKYNIYSLGRYATWRNILLDDLVKDLKMIARFINENNPYFMKQHSAKEVKT